LNILFAHNYNMPHAWELAEQGELPWHHLWGSRALVEAGHHIMFAKFDGKGFLNRFNRSGPLGDLVQQKYILRQNGFDVIYAGIPDATRLIALLKRIGCMKTRCITLFHHPVGLATGAKRWTESSTVKGCDVHLCLSRRVSESVKLFLSPASPNPPILTWGPDLAFYGPPSPLGDTVLSAGKTGRDFNTLLRAASELPYSFEILSDAPLVSPGSNVQIQWGPDGTVPFSHREVRECYRKSRIVAIPLQPWESLVGLTGLLDALAMGRPVLCTRNPCIDVDIEEIGCGFWLDPFDVKAWREKIQQLYREPSLAEEMGAKGRAFCEEKLNLQTFERQLLHVIENLD